MKTGDKIKFKDYGRYETKGVSHNYDYTKSSTLAQTLKVNVAKALRSPLNEGTIIADGATETHILVEYIDDNNYKGVLFFERKVLELIQPKEEVINNYEIY